MDAMCVCMFVCVELTCEMGEKRLIVVVFLFDRYFENWQWNSKDERVDNNERDWQLWVDYRESCVYLEVFPSQSIGPFFVFVLQMPLAPAFPMNPLHHSLPFLSTNDRACICLTPKYKYQLIRILRQWSKEPKDKAKHIDISGRQRLHNSCSPLKKNKERKMYNVELKSPLYFVIWFIVSFDRHGHVVIVLLLHWVDTDSKILYIGRIGIDWFHRLTTVTRCCIINLQICTTVWSSATKRTYSNEEKKNRTINWFSCILIFYFPYNLFWFR